ncbi:MULTISPECIES: signal recognition particle-docking protein FtsY [Methanocorpusculum]|jgi:fused signal recognition particle receptor|uniref:Signal recognition particle receptor FtsY n=1 Tax=Methanocorpusculum parvum TaxID=2193 RepID=A0AAX0Q8J7_9EURY|nr:MULTISPECIES: signal recognition particle-docking protein FtsY [Methanocorpusculum]MDD2249161.1 signal recognition particle-docking protein FtsY [Methanocorpusculum sp.]MDD2803624.1 signal recognition particle-docking protein FtsY [Methanocorpusculum sp.]MDD3047162.1 signal recognition particle-docking protein FtsY [Methanocorpusculum sp.]MDD3912772.1 signal recognition particle-docking protein FtsY [Methanocorpusculum sp.]MDD4423486.1 signal recognition particle-docking protein FtsY [Metha
MFEGLKNKLGLGKKKTPAPETEVPAPAAHTIAKPEPEEKKAPGFLNKIKTLVVEHEFVLSEKDIEESLFELQMVLLESDVAYPVAEAITEHMKKELVGTHRKLRESADDVVTDALRHAIEKVLGEGFDLVSYIKNHEKPVKILFTGVNGTGKTTSVAKIAHYLQSQGLSVVVGAGDTFRAGAIEQIRVHCERLGIKLIAHQEGADPSAVLYDTVEYAKAHKTDVVLADSAGRFHNRVNLMNQLEKIKRVMKPDLVFYVDEAVAGNDAVIRAEEFEKTVSTDGVILTKVDMDPKGGAAISIAYTIGKPLVFLGVGQGYDDMKPFTPSLIIDEIFGDD